VLEGEWEIETDGGEIWDLGWPIGGITRITGIGLPPAGHAIQRTPTQHGSTYLGFRLEDREILVGFAWAPDGTLTARRAGRPYKTLSYLAGPLIFRRTMRDHSVRELRQMRFAGGVEGDSDQSFQTVEYSSARFICGDPCWYNPTDTTLTVLYDDMVHALYGDFATLDSDDGLITNGDWYAFPTIAITGPCDDFDLQSTTTGQRLRYHGDIAAGEVVTIVCNPHPAYLSATSSVQGDVQNYIYPEVVFGGFCLWPHPLASNGYNVWELDTVGMDANSSVVFTWEDRYQGV